MKLTDYIRLGYWHSILLCPFVAVIEMIYWCTLGGIGQTLWMIGFAFSAFMTIAVYDLWRWLQQECLLRQILLERDTSVRPERLLSLDHGVKHDSLAHSLVSTLVITGVCAFCALFPGAGVVVSAVIVGLTHLVTLTLLAVCLYWRIDRYRQRKTVTMDIDTTLQVLNAIVTINQ